MRIQSTLLSLIISFPVLGQEYFSDAFIKKDLLSFEKDSKSYLNSMILKKTKPSIKFNQFDIQDYSFIEKKLVYRNHSFAKSLYSIPNANDLVENLVDNSTVIKNIYELDRLKLFNAKVNKQPWSDDYWPIYRGILGNRYAEEEFESLEDWQESHNYVLQNPAKVIFDTQYNELINKLSPSEKYDLLIGENEFALTNYGWQQGKMYFDRYHKVESWMGICHGWAPASYMMDRPQKKIIVKAFNGKNDITFYPSDIKALASLLWANSKTPARFVGGRCSDKNPKTDEVGRLINEQCLDTNPATWHLTLLNQVGIDKKSFVMDATYDYEVWNQPVVGYQFKYFNPITKNPTQNLSEAMVEISNFENDKFKKHRSPNTKFVVGISLEVTYSVETTPEQRETDSEQYDFLNHAYYNYDIEIDEDGNVIGGEWYKNRHPDFLWTPEYNSRAITYGDYYLLSSPDWNGKSELPLKWKELARTMAHRTGAPLARIVESLIKLSNK